jgi:dihydrofolate reductase
MADRIYLTKVHATLPSDVYFPEFDRDEWKEVKSEFIPADAKNEYASTFKILDRKII